MNVNNNEFLNDNYETFDDVKEHYLMLKEEIYDKIERLRNNEVGYYKGEEFITPTLMERQLTIDRLNDDLTTLEWEYEDLEEEYGTRETI